MSSYNSYLDAKPDPMDFLARDMMQQPAELRMLGLQYIAVNAGLFLACQQSSPTSQLYSYARSGTIRVAPGTENESSWRVVQWKWREPDSVFDVEFD